MRFSRKPMYGSRRRKAGKSPTSITRRRLHPPISSVDKEHEPGAARTRANTFPRERHNVHSVDGRGVSAETCAGTGPDIGARHATSARLFRLALLGHRPDDS